MKFKVWHDRNPNFGFGPQTEFNDANFELVAVVNAADEDEVFELTNHIDHPWWENKQVEWHKESRSTSTGDVVEDESGAKFRCMSVGWKQFRTQGKETGDGTDSTVEELVIQAGG